MNVPKLIIAIFNLGVISMIYSQSGWPGNLAFTFSGSLNGNFEAETVPDSIEIPQSGTLAIFQTDSLGAINIIIPSFQKTEGNEEAVDLFFMFMKDEDGVLEPQSWDIQIVDPENPLDISATIIYTPEVDTAIIAELIAPLIDGEIDSSNFNEFFTGIILEILSISYLPVSGTITLNEANDDSISGEFSGLFLEWDWSFPPDYLLINDGNFTYNNPIFGLVDIPIYYQSDWNLMSLPLPVESMPCSHIVEGTVYQFENGGYTNIPQDQILFGSGYWMRFENAEECSFSGMEVNFNIIELLEGWNLIGGISSPVNVEDILDPGQIIIPETIFSFSETYAVADIVEPGRGYWIKASGNGVITLSTMNRN